MALPEYNQEALDAELHRGGAIGAGLFLSSGSSIAIAGPGGVLLAYICIGFIVGIVMSSLGEMATYIPVTGSFGTYASRFVDPAFGFVLGWSYWCTWAIGVAVELSYAGTIMKFWFPNVNTLIWSGFCLFILVLFNIISVSSYGEVEYWLSLTKVITIIVFIFVAILVASGVIGGDEAYGFTTWGKDPFHNGFMGFFSILLTTNFAFLGAELVGITAGESKCPRRDVPKAVNQVFLRITLFYLLSIFMMGIIIPYDDERLTSSDNAVIVSPFTLVFKKMKTAEVTNVMNAIVLVTILSAGNSGLYAASRVLYTLSKEGKAPAFLSRVSKRGIPYFALLASASVGTVTFSISLIESSRIFHWLSILASVSIFIAWFGICLSHIRFRKAYLAQGRYLEDLPYLARFHPYGPWFVIVVLVLLVLAQGFIAFGPGGVNIAYLIASYIAPILFILMYGIYKVVMRTKVVPIEEMDLDTGRQVYLVEHEKELMKREHEEQKLRAGNAWERFKRTRFVKFLNWI